MNLPFYDTNISRTHSISPKKWEEVYSLFNKKLQNYDKLKMLSDSLVKISSINRKYNPNNQSLEKFYEFIKLLCREKKLSFFETSHVGSPSYALSYNDNYSLYFVLNNDKNIGLFRHVYLEINKQKSLNCPDLTNDLNNGDYFSLIRHLNELIELFSIESESLQQQRTFLCLQSMEEDIDKMSTCNLVNKLEDSSAEIPKPLNIIGNIRKRNGGLPMEILFYQLKSSEKNLNDRYCGKIKLQRHSSKNLLAFIPLTRLQKDTNGNSTVSFTNADSISCVELNSKFQLELNQEIVVNQNTVESLEKVTGFSLESLPNRGNFYMDLILNDALSSKTHKQQIVSILPNEQRLIYQLHPRSYSQGRCIRVISYCLSSSVPQILALLKCQAVINEFLQSFIYSDVEFAQANLTSAIDDTSQVVKLSFQSFSTFLLELCNVQEENNLVVVIEFDEMARSSIYEHDSSHLKLSQAQLDRCQHILSQFNNANILMFYLLQQFNRIELAPPPTSSIKCTSSTSIFDTSSPDVAVDQVTDSQVTIDQCIESARKKLNIHKEYNLPCVSQQIQIRPHIEYLEPCSTNIQIPNVQNYQTAPPPSTSINTPLQMYLNSSEHSLQSHHPLIHHHHHHQAPPPYYPVPPAHLYYPNNTNTNTTTHNHMKQHMSLDKMLSSDFVLPFSSPPPPVTSLSSHQLEAASTNPLVMNPHHPHHSQHLAHHKPQQQHHTHHQQHPQSFTSQQHHYNHMPHNNNPNQNNIPSSILSSNNNNNNISCPSNQQHSHLIHQSNHPPHHNNSQQQQQQQHNIKTEIKSNHTQSMLASNNLPSQPNSHSASLSTAQSRVNYSSNQQQQPITTNPTSAALAAPYEPLTSTAANTSVLVNLLNCNSDSSSSLTTTSTTTYHLKASSTTPAVTPCVNSTQPQHQQTHISMPPDPQHPPVTYKKPRKRKPLNTTSSAADLTPSCNDQSIYDFDDTTDKKSSNITTATTSHHNHHHHNKHNNNNNTNNTNIATNNTNISTQNSLKFKISRNKPPPPVPSGATGGTTPNPVRNNTTSQLTAAAAAAGSGVGSGHSALMSAIDSPMTCSSQASSQSTQIRTHNTNDNNANKRKLHNNSSVTSTGGGSITDVVPKKRKKVGHQSTSNKLNATQHKMKSQLPTSSSAMLLSSYNTNSNSSLDTTGGYSSSVESSSKVSPVIWPPSSTGAASSLLKQSLDTSNKHHHNNGSGGAVGLSSGVGAGLLNHYKIPKKKINPPTGPPATLGGLHHKIASMTPAAASSGANCAPQQQQLPAPTSHHHQHKSSSGTNPVTNTAASTTPSGSNISENIFEKFALNKSQQLHNKSQQLHNKPIAGANNKFLSNPGAGIRFPVNPQHQISRQNYLTNNKYTRQTNPSGQSMHCNIPTVTSGAATTNPSTMSSNNHTPAQAIPNATLSATSAATNIITATSSHFVPNNTSLIKKK